MKGKCQLQLCTHCHTSFDALPYPLVILVCCLKVNHKAYMMLYEATTSQLITFKRFLFVTYYFLNFASLKSDCYN